MSQSYLLKVFLLSLLIAFSLCDECLEQDQVCIGTEQRCCEELTCRYVGFDGQLYMCQRNDFLTNSSTQDQEITKVEKLKFLSTDSQVKNHNLVHPFEDEDCLKKDEVCVNTHKRCCKNLSCKYVTESGVMYGCDE